MNRSGDRAPGSEFLQSAGSMRSIAYLLPMEEIYSRLRRDSRQGPAPAYINTIVFPAGVKTLRNTLIRDAYERVARPFSVVRLQGGCAPLFRPNRLRQTSCARSLWGQPLLRLA